MPASKAELACRGTFNVEVRDYVVAQGGTVVDGPIGPAARIETKAGPLYVEGVGTWVHCRFEDTTRANKHFGNEGKRIGLGFPNPFTGKYNFHGDNRDESFEAFKRALARLRE